MEDATLAGYHIPAGTPVIANLWAIHHDPSAWGDDAFMFNPDRFLDSRLNVNGTNYQFLPFGAGRR
jgi:cytochrome P450